MAVASIWPATCSTPQRLVFPRCLAFPFRRRLCVSHLCSSHSTPFQIACKASRRITNHGRNGRRVQPAEGRGRGRGNFEGEEDFIEEEEDDDDDEEDEEDRSLDLLARFLQNVFKKISKRARKATASILPSAISPQLVAFSVDGVIVLTSLSIVKAFLEVLVQCCISVLSEGDCVYVAAQCLYDCTYVISTFAEVVCMLGSVVFGAILLVRLIWSAVTYIQMNGKNINIRGNDVDTSYAGIQLRYGENTTYWNNPEECSCLLLSCLADLI